MCLKKKAKSYYKKLWHLPPSEYELAEFAELILNEFIDELDKNITTVVWNYGLDSVIFKDRPVDNKKSLDQIKEEFLNGRDNKQTIGSDEAHTIDATGTRVDGRETGDEKIGRDNQLNKDSESEVQRSESQEVRETNQDEE